MKINNKLDNIFQDDFPVVDNDLEVNVTNDGDESESSLLFNNEDGEDDDESQSSLILITEDGEELESYSESMRSPSPESSYSESMRSPSPESSECLFKFRPVKKEMVSNDLQREECDRLIGHAQELQNTLDLLSHRLDQVKEKNLRLKSEKMLLGQYIGTLISASNMYSNAV